MRRNSGGSRLRISIGLPGLGLVAAWLAGCGQNLFPHDLVVRHETTLALDTNRDDRPDYWQHVDDEGQKFGLEFDTDGDGQPDLTVRPRDVARSDRLHVVFVMDGVPFEVIDELYREGRFRLFRPPSRLVSVFPAMTDLALARAFTDETCLGYEALYFDLGKQVPSNGNAVYLSGKNEPWVKEFDYRCSPWLDAKSYLDPEGLWRHELAGIEKMISQHQTGTVRAYSVATAGLGTRRGREAIVTYLLEVDRFCERLTHERQGRVTFTLMADHGHDLVPAVRARLDERLRAADYKLSKRLKHERCVFVPSYGLVSCAVMHTPDPRGVADAIVGDSAVDLVMYRESAGGGSDDAIVVRTASATARVERTADGFIYDHAEGDPLHLRPILARLQAEGQVAADGSIADRAWLEATADHVYPDALWRIWCAFNGLVRNPADVLVSLREGYFTGSGFFSAMISVASTHGALSRRSSLTFVMSNDKEFPPLLRVEDLRPLLGKPAD